MREVSISDPDSRRTPVPYLSGVTTSSLGSLVSASGSVTNDLPYVHGKPVALGNVKKRLYLKLLCLLTAPPLSVRECVSRPPSCVTMVVTPPVKPTLIVLLFTYV